ncbi:GNAT family N-acetyltransferase [Poseidonocella sedimentorum]|uniref:Acetyltransferase (GNAT) family protein n=1 Tax=Poseidonocella sedimentorum TaxID=871652 RepID=A0A1I6EM57_9RHOB|nr:GNAT family N-acetyltransferase [Poseidonocella sedimentorum]SFR18552.1 Acetyltransferase (GNAT) family protein [Poseidonocella sedimentorum]
MTISDISRIRRFNRAVTREVGALDHSFLGRGRPLGAARVLNAIGQGIDEVGALRANLGLDSGLLSRLLRGLEGEVLITLARDDADGRRRRARLTPAGQAEFEAYETLSDTRATDLLAAHPNTSALLTAMDLIATTLGREEIEIAETDPRAEAAIHCLEAYYAELAARFDGGFDVSLSCDPEAASMTAPRGAFFVALSDGMPLGCVGLKGTDLGYAEIKRLWVAPSARGLGLARKLMTRAEAAAQKLGITTLRLDTNAALTEAQAFYRNSGWHEIPRYNDDPYPTHFFEKAVAAPGA